MRVFKTAWFERSARKARIKDDELCGAIDEVMRGLADDLGGGVFKKRLNKNMHEASFWPRVVGTGYSNICLRRRIEPILKVASSRTFVF